jgi:hypothetical protein
MKRNHHWRWCCGYREATCPDCGSHLLVIRDPERPGAVALDILNSTNQQRIVHHLGEMLGCRGKHGR